MLKTLDSASNLIRAIVSLGVMAIVSVAGWFGYDTYFAGQRVLREKDEQLAASRAQIEELTQDVAAKQREIERLDTALQLLKVDHRMATIEVLEQKQDPASGKLRTRFSFVETDDDGRPLETPREFTIDGDVVHVDALVISFEDEYVEKGDPLKGTALSLFRRIHGDEQKPSDAFPLDPVRGRPAAYNRGDALSDFQKQLWEDFWEYANNPKKAEEEGVRTAQGKASYTKMRPKMRYKLMLRSTGDFTIHPEPAPQKPL